MKKTKIIIPAMGMLLLGTAASVTGTVAWFSANNSVNVNGMTVTTTVKGNLLIADSQYDNDGDGRFGTSNLSQTRTGILEPVSTVNGLNFFYTKDKVSGTGATTDTALQTYTNDSALATYYDVVGAKGFVDYSFYLKATSGSDSEKLVISRFNLLYNGDVLDAGDASWRVAVFAKPVAEATAAADLISTDLKSIIGPAGKDYFTDGQAIQAADGTRGSVSGLGSEALIDTIATRGTTQRYYVVVRLFLEGEDESCTNETYAPLTQSYKLSLQCKLGDNGATQISSLRMATAAQENCTANVVLDDACGETASTYSWEKYNNSTHVYETITPAATAATYEGSAGDKVRCKVNGYYYSNEVTLANE